MTAKSRSGSRATYYGKVITDIRSQVSFWLEFENHRVCLGKANDACISKIYVNLVQTLNAIFPDYDFSYGYGRFEQNCCYRKTRPDLFICQENGYLVMNTVNRYLSQIYELQSQSMNWMDLGNSQIFWRTFGNPSTRSYRFASATCTATCRTSTSIRWVRTICILVEKRGKSCRWSFNYFFYNNKLKKIVFFSCSCKRYA